MTSPVPDLLDIQQWFPPVEKTVCGKRKRPSSTRLWTMRNIKKADDFNYYIIHIIHLDDTNSQHHVGRSGTLKDLLDVIEIHCDEKQQDHFLELVDRTGEYLIDIDRKDKPLSLIFFTEVVYLRIKTSDEVSCKKSHINACTSLLDDEKTSDVVFEVRGCLIYAHRVFLSNRNTYFEKLLGNGCLETSQKRICINGCDYITFKSLLSYLYSNQLILPSDISLVIKLFVLADMYDVIDLKKELVLKIKEMLKPETVLDILFHACENNTLSDICLEYIQNHYMIVFEDEQTLREAIDKYKEFTEFSTIFAKILLF